MATTFRTVFKLIAGFFAILPAASANAEPTANIVAGSEKLTMSEFIARLRQDPALRAQFRRNSRAVLREAGIDPTPFDLADQLDEKVLARLLANWAADASARPQLAQASTQPPTPPAVVYGPPPSPPRRPPSDQQATPPPAPSAPVYGPPPAPPPR
jgi:hypothetical protein